MKSIRITKENKTHLEETHSLEKGYLELSSGLYLISNMSGTRVVDAILTRGAYQASYFETEPLADGYMAVTPRGSKM